MGTIERARPLLRRDVFPAEVVMPDGRVFTAARVFVLEASIRVYVEDRARIGRPGIELAVDEPLTDPELVPRSHSTLGRGERLECRIDAGTIWVNRGRGCGCHSPLKALRATEATG